MLPPAKPRSRRPTSRTTRRLFAKRRLRAGDARQRQVEAGSCLPPTERAGLPRPRVRQRGAGLVLPSLPLARPRESLPSLRTRRSRRALCQVTWGRVYSAPLWMGRCRRSVVGDPNSSYPGGTRNQTCRDFNREGRGSRARSSERARAVVSVVAFGHCPCF